MSRITLSQANTIIDAAFAKAAELGLKPLGISVLDAGGHLIAYQGQDGSPIMRHQIATGKAFGALAVGRSSRALGKLAEERPHFFTGLSGVSNGRIVPVPGGVLVRDAASEIIGAIGVSGDTSDNDEICAVAGIEAVGLNAEV